MAGMTGFALLTLSAPASALTVTAPTQPAPLPTLPFPTGASVSGGTGGAPSDVSVTGPDSGIDVQLPGIPALPIGPTGPVTTPGGSTLPAPVLTPFPAPASLAPGASPSPGGDSNTPVAGPVDQGAVEMPAASIGAGAAPPANPAEATAHGDVGASITAQPADSLLARVPGIASRVALWAALAAVVFVLHMLVGSAVRQHRRKSVRVS